MPREQTGHYFHLLACAPDCTAFQQIAPASKRSQNTDVQPREKRAEAGTEWWHWHPSAPQSHMGAHSWCPHRLPTPPSLLQVPACPRGSDGDCRARWLSEKLFCYRGRKKWPKMNKTQAAALVSVTRVYFVPACRVSWPPPADGSAWSSPPHLQKRFLSYISMPLSLKHLLLLKDKLGGCGQGPQARSPSCLKIFWENIFRR